MEAWCGGDAQVGNSLAARGWEGGDPRDQLGQFTEDCESQAKKQWAGKLLEPGKQGFVWILEGGRSDAWRTGSRVVTGQKGR